jgi:hypothetical protein
LQQDGGSKLEDVPERIFLEVAPQFGSIVQFLVLPQSLYFSLAVDRLPEFEIQSVFFVDDNEPDEIAFPVRLVGFFEYPEPWRSCRDKDLGRLQRVVVWDVQAEEHDLGRSHAILEKSIGENILTGSLVIAISGSVSR